MHPSDNSYHGGKSTSNRVTNTPHLPTQIGIVVVQVIAVSDTMKPSFILTYYDTKYVQKV